MPGEQNDGPFDDPLSLDMRRDLSRIDAVTTQILKDDRNWNDFLRDPNGTMIRFGLHPPTTREINEGANRTIYASLTNRKVQEIMSRHYAEFRSERREEYREVLDEGLREGRIQYDLDFDLEGAWHLLNNKDVTSDVLTQLLRDFKDRGLLQENHSDEQIDAFVKETVDAITERRPLREHPTLEKYDENYGIGPQAFCSTLAECAAVVTLGVGAEGAAYVTAIVEVGFWGFTAERAPSTSEPVEAPVVADVKVVIADGYGLGFAALGGDEGTLRKLEILGKLANLTGNMLAHIHNFEQRPPVRRDE